ncbi:MAG: MerR family transcriptional regulator [Dehalococcoidia bacterium]
MSIEELVERTGVPLRTIRFYISEGLLPGPEGRGRTAFYDEEHLLRLRLIRRLSEQRMPLTEQKEKLPHLTLDQVRALLMAADRHDVELQEANGETSAPAYISALLQRARAVQQSQPRKSAPAIPRSTQDFRPAPAASPADPERGESWRRYELAPGVELHVQTAAESRHRGLVERLLRLSAEEGADSHS